MAIRLFPSHLNVLGGFLITENAVRNIIKFKGYNGAFLYSHLKPTLWSEALEISAGGYIDNGFIIWLENSLFFDLDDLPDNFGIFIVKEFDQNGLITSLEIKAEDLSTYTPTPNHTPLVVGKKSPLSIIDCREIINIRSLFSYKYTIELVATDVQNNKLKFITISPDKDPIKQLSPNGDQIYFRNLSLISLYSNLIGISGDTCITVMLERYGNIVYLTDWPIGSSPSYYREPPCCLNFIIPPTYNLQFAFSGSIDEQEPPNFYIDVWSAGGI